MALGLHIDEEMAEDGFQACWLRSERVIPDKGDPRDYWIEISSDRDFLGPTPLYVYIREPEHGPRDGHHHISVAQYLLRYAEGRNSGARLSGGHFIRHLAAHFGLVSDAGLRGLGSLRLERQQVTMAGAPKAAEDAPIDVEGALAILTPVQVAQPPLATRNISQRFIMWPAEADKEVNVEDKGSGEKGGSIADQVSTARPEVSAASVLVNVSVATSSTPPTTATIFGDEDLTIAQTLIKLRSEKAKVKGVAFRDVDEPPRLTRSTTTL
uniref:Uncharacterized protein n=1 Tax=Tanacetum cinerariifolium TaxID=118510 RepID=A0A699J8A2_TANCI|nr:hypothetical protein [Tanacetum cinerariifolium]